MWGCLLVCFYKIIEKYRKFKTQETCSLEHEKSKRAEEQIETAPTPKPWSFCILYQTFYLTSRITKITGFYVIRDVSKVFWFSCGGWSTYQKRCPHRLITASLAVSKQMLHSKVLSWFALSPAPLLLLLPLVPPVLEFFVEVEVVGPLLAILKDQPETRSVSSCWNPSRKKGKKPKQK